MPTRAHDRRKPGTLKEVLSRNVQHQQRRSDATASPPDAQRPPRERSRSAAKKRTQL